MIYPKYRGNKNKTQKTDHIFFLNKRCNTQHEKKENKKKKNFIRSD